MFCQQCGAKVGADYSFCVSCGAKLSNVSSKNVSMSHKHTNASAVSSLKSKSFDVDAILNSNSANLNIFIAVICIGTIITDILSYLLIGSARYVFSNHWYYYVALVTIAVLVALKIDLKIFISGLGLLAITELVYFIKAFSNNSSNIFLCLVSFVAVMLAIFLAVVNAFNVLGEEKEKVNKYYFIPAIVALFVLFLKLTFGGWLIWVFYDLTSFDFLGLFSWGFSIVSELLFAVAIFLIGKYSINNK